MEGKKISEHIDLRRVGKVITEGHPDEGKEVFLIVDNLTLFFIKKPNTGVFYILFFTNIVIWFLRK